MSRNVVTLKNQMYLRHHRCDFSFLSKSALEIRWLDGWRETTFYYTVQKENKCCLDRYTLEIMWSSVSGWVRGLTFGSPWDIYSTFFKFTVKSTFEVCDFELFKRSCGFRHTPLWSSCQQYFSSPSPIYVFWLIISVHILQRSALFNLPLTPPATPTLFASVTVFHHIKICRPPPSFSPLLTLAPNKLYFINVN